MFGGIEAGGTKFICAVADEDLTIIERKSFKTTTPKETMNQVIDFFKTYQSELRVIGIGSFGPIDLNKASNTYGYITSTPKLAWQNFNFLEVLENNFSIPFVWTTDVNAAAYGEFCHGNGVDYQSLVYFTIGTGVGGGAIQNGEFIQGFSHPEMGHMLIQPHSKDTFEGNCAFHKSCLEGMASGPAIEKRLGVKGQDLSADHEYWEIEADYIAQCAYNTTLVLAPEKLIFGGGVMQQEHMIKKVRKKFEQKMNGYVTYPDLETYIQTPKLGNNAGIIGCLALAKEKFNKD